MQENCDTKYNNRSDFCDNLKSFRCDEIAASSRLFLRLSISSINFETKVRCLKRIETEAQPAKDLV